jgi:LysM repeat protein/ABC-type branched-subunit amino acid transport system substrate-binding protein
VNAVIEGPCYAARDGAKRAVLGSVFLFVLFLSTMRLSAQETRTIDGRTYTVHVVQAGQTIYAIGRSHAIPVEALLQANPAAAEGLSIGQEILIPKDAVAKKELKTAPILEEGGELRHTVVAKETLFGISRQYGVEVNDLLERNPELNAGLRAGMTVMIPTSKVTGQKEVAVRPAMAEEWVEHTVQAGETLYSLGQHYGVSQERIASANGGLPEGLKAGAVLRIPVAPGYVPAPVVAPKPAVAAGKPYTIALMLPFSVERNDSVLAASAQGSEARYHEATRIAAQFNGGARMALDSLEKLGLRAKVHILDTGEDPRTWGPVLKNPELKNVDLFIGPFHRSAIEQLAAVVPSAHIVCPVPQSNKVILGNPTVSKVTATRTDLIRHTARYVAQRHAKDNIIVLKPEIHADKETQDQLLRALNEALARQPERMRDSALVLRPGRRDIGDLASKLKSDKLNVIVVPSEDVEFVTSLVTKLKPLAGDKRIALVGLEAWTALETVSTGDLDVLGFMYASATFADYSDPATQRFVTGFRDRYKNDVDEYAFLGFDVTFYYVKALMERGEDFPDHFGEVGSRPLHMGFRMTRTGPENGYRNEFAVMLMQQDLQLKKAP